MLRRSVESLYFAYGSNLSTARMRARVASARSRGAARLPGFRLTLDKRSRDGSGKANLRPDPDQAVFGVLYALASIHWPDLDACEPGYRRVPVRVELRGRQVEAFTYLSRDWTPSPVAYDWYKALIVDGAAEHGLPRAWRQRLATLPARPDPRDG